jgi:hypothetical protein
MIMPITREMATAIINDILGPIQKNSNIMPMAMAKNEKKYDKD